MEADGSVAICQGSHFSFSHFSFFVDWYNRGWEHATYTIFNHSIKDLAQSSKYKVISYSRTKLQSTWDSCSYQHNITTSSAYKAPWIHAGIQFRTSFMKIMKSVRESTPPWGTPSLRISFLLWCCWFCTCPFLFSNRMSLALIRRSTMFPREFTLIRRSITFTIEVVEAICLWSHFSFFVDWYHRGWKHATYTIFNHSTKDLVQSSKYADILYSRTKLQPTCDSCS